MMLRAFRKSNDSVPGAVRLYIGQEQKQIIVAPMHQNLAGIYYEQSEVVYFDSWPTEAELGQSFQAAFERFSVAEADLRDGKKSDWPSYKASGSKSMREFEARFKRMECHALNAANVLVRASMPHPTVVRVELSVTFNPKLSPSEVGEYLNVLANAARRA